LTSRLAVVLAFLICWSGMIGVRLYRLQVTEHEAYSRRAAGQQLLQVSLDSPRSTIFDADGRQLAVSMTVDSAFAVPREIADRAATFAALDEVLDVDRARLEKAFGRSREFAWVKRKLDPPLARALREADLEGIHFVRESKRFYPMDELAAATLGFVGLDDYGLGGLEALYDDALSGEGVQRTLLRDARAGTVQFPALSFREAEPGDDLYLTIDATVQHIVERELSRAVSEARARAGAAVLLDPSSGAILAMATVPTFNPNRFGEVDSERWKSLPVTSVYEPGSTFKIITAASAIEANLIDPSAVVDCEMGGITLDRVRINDHKPFGKLTFREVIAKSSNVGAIKIGLAVGGQKLYDTIRAFGFGEPTGVDLPGEAAGIVHPLDNDDRRATAYVSFGQGISVTPLQMANAFAAVANGGYLYRPYLVAARGRGGKVEALNDRPRLIGRPITAATARSLERLLEGVVEEGTGRAAQIPGYRVAGKTGTAQVPVAGGYSPDRFIASFVGFAPARRPAVVGAIAIFEPRGRYHGGEVAAPVFSAIARDVLVHLGVAPERDPLERWPGERPRRASVGSEGSERPAGGQPTVARAADREPAGAGESREAVLGGARQP
jgi:cell division protein FtsI (penicillin-binding protein 3)